MAEKSNIEHNRSAGAASSSLIGRLRPTQGEDVRKLLGRDQMNGFPFGDMLHGN
jgi:hypothetical protein